MEKTLNLYNKAKTLNNNQLRELISFGDYKGQRRRRCPYFTVKINFVT